MAKSNAQEQRAHLARSGRRDPAANRHGLDTNSISMHVRKTPTRQEKQDRALAKHKSRSHIHA